jgi:two-component system, NtrC family, sensor kinase
MSEMSANLDIAIDTNMEALIGDNERLRHENQQLRGLASGISDANRRATDLMLELELTKDMLETRVEERTAELKRALEEHARLTSAVEQAAEMVIIADTNRTIQYVNPAFERTMGFSREEIIGTSAMQLVDGNDTENTIKAIREATEGGDVWIGQLVEKKRDGRLITVDASISPVRDEDGVIRHFVGVLRDITQEVKLEAQLQASSKMEAIGHLAAGIAHEINTPTQYVGDNTRFLQDSFTDILEVLKKYDDLLAAVESGADTLESISALKQTTENVEIDYLRDEIPQAIEQSLEGVDRVAKIVRAMREFSHPGMDEKSPTDMNRAIENTLSVTRNAWKYVAELETSLEETLPAVVCLPGDINQVLLNLIVNAAHAIEDGIKERGEEKGVLSIRTQSDEKWVEIQIGDTGSGIPTDVQSKIFHPFFTTKEMGRGTGQGLSIAHNVIVQKHGGNLTFDTEPGKGTVFTIRLPLTPVAWEG